MAKKAKAEQTIPVATATQPAATKAKKTAQKGAPKSGQPAAAADSKIAATAQTDKPAKTPKEKKEPRKTTAQLVRDYLQANPDMKNREIVMALAAQGIVIDDSIPSQIRSRDKKGRAPKVEGAPQPAKTEATGGKPTVFVSSPIHKEFVSDLLESKTHSQVVKSIRILVAKLNRIIEMMEAMKDDDWEIKLLVEQDGLMYSAQHALVTTGAQARARIEKLGIKPNEVVLVA